jgi:FMN phosphatase YigB (HAD superfamily)
MKLISDEVHNLILGIKAKGIRVAIATNNTDSFTRWTVPSLGLDVLFDNVLNSFDLGGLKWDVGDKGQSIFFACFLQQYGIDSGESMLIDDNAGTKEHAITRSFGIQYRQIATGTGLVPELKTLLVSLP